MLSSQGEISVSRRGNRVELKTSNAHSICIQLVPHLAGGLITTSSSRNGNPVHSALSDIIIWYRCTPPMYIDRRRWLVLCAIQPSSRRSLVRNSGPMEGSGEVQGESLRFCVRC